jgi:staphylococcal nuclease domain-containing protein 1
LADGSFVKLVPKSSEYGPEAWRRFSQLTEGKKLIANIDQKEGNILHLRLIDPTDPNAADDPLACLNADLVREGELTDSWPEQKLMNRLRYS